MRFVLVCEGQSDAGLVPHIQQMIIENSGEAEVQGEHWCHGSQLESKIRGGLKAADNMVDLLFVHRDANNAGADARQREIDLAVAAALKAPRFVAVIPVRMTEAWLLLDETAIRKVVGKSKRAGTVGSANAARGRTPIRSKANLGRRSLGGQRDDWPATEAHPAGFRPFPPSTAGQFADWRAP